jgi:hypothetical protein
MKDRQELSELTSDSCNPSIPESSAAPGALDFIFFPPVDIPLLAAPLEDAALPLMEWVLLLLLVKISRFVTKLFVDSSSTQ